MQPVTSKKQSHALGSIAIILLLGFIKKRMIHAYGDY